MKERVRLPYWMAYVLLMGGVAGVACGADNTVLDQTALVKGFALNHEKFCNFQMPIASRHDELEELHLKKDSSKFKLKKRRTEDVDKADGTGKETKPISYLDVKNNSKSQIEFPDMRAFNEKKPPLETDYCAEGGDLGQHVYAFGIHDLEDPDTGASSPHAFIYIPMNLKGKAPQGLGNFYYLVLLTITNDSSQCDPKVATYPRCKALRELAVMKLQGVKGKQFRDAVEQRIAAVLPAHQPYPFSVVAFHNGVIHGSL